MGFAAPVASWIGSNPAAAAQIGGLGLGLFDAFKPQQAPTFQQPSTYTPQGSSIFNPLSNSTVFVPNTSQSDYYRDYWNEAQLDTLYGRAPTGRGNEIQDILDTLGYDPLAEVQGPGYASPKAETPEEQARWEALQAYNEAGGVYSGPGGTYDPYGGSISNHEQLDVEQRRDLEAQLAGLRELQAEIDAGGINSLYNPTDYQESEQAYRNTLTQAAQNQYNYAQADAARRGVGTGGTVQNEITQNLAESSTEAENMVQGFVSNIKQLDKSYKMSLIQMLEGHANQSASMGLAQMGQVAGMGYQNAVLQQAQDQLNYQNQQYMNQGTQNLLGQLGQTAGYYQQQKQWDDLFNRYSAAPTYETHGVPYR
jgi:hypothetical protein